MSKSQEKDKEGTYFIKDESLSSVDNDAFNHRDISKVLMNIIDKTEPPFNIAVIGKWGLGKSSLINMAISKYKMKGESFSVHEINAWKYEKEALTKVFLKQLWEGVEGNKIKSFEQIKQRYGDIINAIRKSVSTEEKDNTYSKIITSCIVFGLFSLVAFIGYKLVQGSVNKTDMATWDFWFKVFLSYCKNVMTILLVPILLIIANLFLATIMGQDKKNIALNIDVQSTDEYEMLLEDKIREKLIKNKDYRIITVIDDLDRLSINKIVEALDAIKAFVGFDRCIFIVPFDDAILKKALEVRRINGLQTDNDIIESELILDKLFQFKIYLPPILKYDIKEYAMQLVKEKSPDFLRDYCNETIMNDLLKSILIHSGVTTPRQVKKIINIFMSNFIIAYNREVLSKVEGGILTSDSGIRQIAKISVLQADFNEFYDLLFKDFSYIDLMLDCYQRKIDIIDIPLNLTNYFIKEQGKTKIKNEYIGLVNFLSWTQKYKTEYIDPYMFLAQEKISRKTGDANFRKLINAIESNNTTLVTEIIDENMDNVDILNYKIENSFDDEIPSVLEIAINVFNSIDDAQKKKIANSITSKAEELSSTGDNANYEKFTPQNVIDIFYVTDNKDFGVTMISDYLLSLNNINSNKNLCGAIGIFIENENLFNADIENSIKKISSKILSDDEVELSLINKIVEPYWNNSAIYMKYFGEIFFDRIITELEVNNSFDELVLNSFIHAFNILELNIDTNELIKKMLGLFAYPALLSVINKVLTKSIKNKINQDNANIIAESLITLDIDAEAEKEFTINTLEILNNLLFSINKALAVDFDSFIYTRINYNEMEDLLFYVGERNYFELLPETVKDLIKNVFESNLWDEIFNRVEKFLTLEQRKLLESNLITNSIYPTFRTITPNRLISLFSALSKNVDNNDIINLCIHELISQFKSYYNEVDFFDFVSDLIGNQKQLINDTSLDEYLSILKAIFSNNINRCILSIQRLQQRITDNQWSWIMPLLIQNVMVSNFDLVFSIIEDNSRYFNKTNNNLSQHVNFLVDTMDISSDPNKNVASIDKHFTKISRINDFLSKSVTNENVDKELASIVGVKLLSGMELNNLSDCVIESAKDNMIFIYITSLLYRIKKYRLSDILTSISEKLTITIPIQSIEILLDVCQMNESKVDAGIVLKIAALNINHVNELEVVLNTCNKLAGFSNNFFSQRKDDISLMLYSCFHNTSSDLVKKGIVQSISDLRLRRQFKKHLLVPSELDVYNSNLR